MKVIVTGGLGFIGSNLVEKLVRDKHEVTVIDNLSTGTPHNRIPKANYWLCEMSNSLHAIMNAEKYDVLFHLAAIPRVTYSIEQPLITTQQNVMGTVTLLDSIRLSPPEKRPRLVYSSSSSIYGVTDQLPTPTDHPANPKSPYALQKWQGEEWIRLYCELYDLDAVCLRYFNVFGPRSRHGGAYSTVLSAWMYNLLINEDPPAYLEGEGDQTRDFCYVDNVVQANILAAQSETNFKGKAFNVAQGIDLSLIDCQHLIEELTGKVLDLEKRPERVGDIKDTLADINETIKLLGYKPNIDIAKQFKSMIDWYKNEYRKELQQNGE